MRFPRFTRRWRDDKAPEGATTTTDLTFNIAPGFARVQSCGLEVCGRSPMNLCTKGGS